jgi:hypothetical protein
MRPNSIQLLELQGKGSNLQARVWNFTATNYSGPTDIILVKNVFAFMFTNIGDTKAFINGIVVFPSATPTTALGDSRSLAGHTMDLFKGVMRLSFVNPGGAAPLVEVVQLFYAESYE